VGKCSYIHQHKKIEQIGNMGIFSFLGNKDSFNLKKSDFKYEKKEVKVESSGTSESLLNSIAEFKRKAGYTEKEINSNPTAEPSKFSIETSITKVSLFGQTIEINYDPSEIQMSEDEYIVGINQRLNWASKNKTEIESVIVRDLLLLKNESWLNEEEIAISQKDFVDSLTLTSLSFDHVLAFNLNFNDGDLFWGHEIILQIEENCTIKTAKIEG
jgi:hypothetical protein